jgi:hypothetical protein
METVMNRFIVTLVTTLGLMSPAFAQLGNINEDLIYVPVTPCRVFDTRFSAVPGPIPANGILTVPIGVASTYAPSGGSDTVCGLGGLATNNNFAAAVINLAAWSQDTNLYGYVTAYPANTTVPTAATLNFGATPGDIRSTLATVKLNNNLLSIQVKGTSAHLIGDIVGYYSRPRGTNLACSNPPETTLSVAPGVLATLAIPACATTNSYSSIGGYCYTDGAEMLSYAGAQGGECKMKNMGVTPANIVAGRRCCGVPGGRPFF